MPDKFSPEIRSRIMSSIRSKNTKPETKIRRITWALGKRFRIHDRTVPGTPDISNKSKKVAVFIDGCFWHGCPKCYKEPQSNSEFWRNKIARNRQRRKTVRKSLKRDGWTVMEFWEHSVKKAPVPIAIKISEIM
ncbi:MAG: very short patch repair endonuclease [Nitrosopumilaceae archaeon]|jgi:DNA mismatch endonuclease (patch repair protein)